MTSFVLFFLPILIYLTYWQTTRGFEKQAIWEVYEENKTLIPLNEQQLDGGSLERLKYRNILLKGKYIDKSFLLDNRMYRKKRGFEVFTPFLAESGKVYLINRGWTNSFEEIEVDFFERVFLIEGILSPFKKYGLDLKNKQETKAFPIVVQELTHQKALQILENNTGLEKMVIQLSAASVGSFEPIWAPLEMQAQRHWGYAVQWFGLAIVLLYLYIYFGIKQAKK